MGILNVNKAVILTLDKRYAQASQLFDACKLRGLDTEIFLAGDGSGHHPVTGMPLDFYDHIDEPHLPPALVGGINYATWYRRPNAFNAWKCHRKIMETALANEAKSILMLEDDSFFEDDFDEIIEKTEEFFTMRVWDMIYLGCYHNDTAVETGHPHVYKMGGGGGFHGVILGKM